MCLARVDPRRLAGVELEGALDRAEPGSRGSRDRALRCNGWRRCYILVGVPGQTIDDVSSVLGEDAAAPAIVMIATGMQPAALVLRPPAELGRQIAAGGQSHEVADERMS